MVELQGEAVVAILTRAPSAGGKSRLFAALGRPPDPALLTALLLDTLDAARGAGALCAVAVEPAACCGEVAALAGPEVVVFGQEGGSLGDRMRAAMAVLFARGARAVALVGSDLPDLDAAEVRRALAWVDEDPGTLALGPAGDGGYYLIAAARVPDVFDGIDWGSPAVLAQTEAAAGHAGLRARRLAPLSDVDTVEELGRVRAPRTRAAAARLLADPYGRACK